MRRSTLAYSTMCLAINALTLGGTEMHLTLDVPDTTELHLTPHEQARGDHNALTTRGTKTNLTTRGTKTNLPDYMPGPGDHSEPPCAEKIAFVRGLAQGERDPDSLAALAAKEAEVRAQCEGLELAETESGMEPTELAQADKVECTTKWIKKNYGFTYGMWVFFVLTSDDFECPEDEETWLGYWCYHK